MTNYRIRSAIRKILDKWNGDTRPCRLSWPRLSVVYDVSPGKAFSAIWCCWMLPVGELLDAIRKNRGCQRRRIRGNLADYAMFDEMRTGALACAETLPWVRRELIETARQDHASRKIEARFLLVRRI